MKADHPTPEAYAAAAWLLMVDVPAMKALAEVEAGLEGAFLPSGEPVILFERHIFHLKTAGRFDASHPEISNANPGGYGAYSDQHRKLANARQLDSAAALQSASWGLFQIMGFNHAAAGYPELQRFVNAMYRSVDDHLRAFSMFLRGDARKVDALREHDWARFAFLYNGPAYAKNAYDRKMAEAFVKHAGVT